MAKKAIYLDERERDLARRLCRLVCSKLRNEGTAIKLTQFALQWTHDEIQALEAKFAEHEVAEAEEGES